MGELASPRRSAGFATYALRAQFKIQYLFVFATGWRHGTSRSISASSHPMRTHSGTSPCTAPHRHTAAQRTETHESRPETKPAHSPALKQPCAQQPSWMRGQPPTLPLTCG